ncbi:Hsp20/alpha crystallin family protein [Motilibacter deserti]|uniref:Hsp20/alpha crystallin family protein n=1 Tax=Motilibacter deserti TaxID=2714956 RepID=A0ABX0GZS9_9ACTN|nr:Hsp20/alpha crystallin family protein [Motilibacter deserti]NHC15080.1 Hsp20/alpha crystallin family protein [Motilibacter deserti]
MAVTRWDPFTALARLDRELDSSFDELVRRAWGSGQRGTAGYVPAVDIRKDGGDVVISVELPGVDIDNDVSIEVANGRLAIFGERRDERTASSEQAEQGKGVLVRELRYGAFRREFALPEHVGADDVDATYDRGMLRVVVHNVAKPVPEPRRIQVRSAETPREVGTDRTVQGQVEA